MRVRGGSAFGQSAAAAFKFVAQDPGPYVVYQPLDGQSLENALRDGPLLWARAAEVVASIATTFVVVVIVVG